MSTSENSEVVRQLRRAPPEIKARQTPGTLGRHLPGFADALWRRRWFLAVVVLPSVAAIFYYGLIASDLYVSEARFVVRNANKPQATSFGMMLQNVGIGAAPNDSYTVHDFILSRDVVRQLESDHDLRTVLSRNEGDFINRFPPPFFGSSFEMLYWTYSRFVSVVIDDTSGIGTLEVRAFRPQDAQTLAKAVLEYSEQLVNRLNERARADAVTVADSEVELAKKRVIQNQDDLTAYRLRTNMLDPANTSAAVLALVARLSAEKAASETQMAEIVKGSPDSPQIVPLRGHIAALQAQIDQQSRKIIGGGDSVVEKLAEYERLMLQREFADKSLASAITSLEEARLEAQRKQLYLERVVEPNLPDYALEPHRLLRMLEIILSALLIYGVAWLVSASVREHVGR